MSDFQLKGLTVKNQHVDFAANLNIENDLSSSFFKLSTKINNLTFTPSNLPSLLTKSLIEKIPKKLLAYGEVKVFGDIFYEGELGIVIGKNCKDVEPDQSRDYIFGYTCINDVTGMDIVKKDPSFDQWTRSKSFDTFCIFGPCISTNIDPLNLQVKSKLNGKTVQNYNTSDMFFNVYEIVSFLSKYLSILPGDIIAC